MAGPQPWRLRRDLLSLPSAAFSQAPAGAGPSRCTRKEGRTEKSNRPERYCWPHRLLRPCGDGGMLSRAALALAQGQPQRLEGVRCFPQPGTKVPKAKPTRAARPGDCGSPAPACICQRGSGVSSQRAVGLAPGSAARPSSGRGLWAQDLSLQSRLHRGQDRFCPSSLCRLRIRPLRPLGGQEPISLRKRCINACGRRLRFGQLGGWSPTQGRRPLR